MTDLTDDVVRQWLDRALAEKGSPNLWTPQPELRRRIIALAEALLKEREAHKDENRYWQPKPGLECPHCKRIVGTFLGCSVGGCPCGEDM
jgi:hypothetical protein